MTLIIQRPTGSTLTLRQTWQPMDPDAAAYITAVETEDGQALEEKVKIAIDNFVLGCKADGIWNAIKASCILAGARTLNGALVLLAGTAPTNYNFVAGDYDRKTGLVGDGSTKYLNSNRNNNADPQNSQHVSVFLSTPGTPVSDTQLYMSATSSVGGLSLGIASSQQFSRNRSTAFTFVGSSAATGLAGISRSAADSYTHRTAGVNTSVSVASQTPADSMIYVFRQNGGASYYSNARIAFYSIGESLDLALLDARVTDLINKFAEVIP